MAEDFFFRCFAYQRNNPALDNTFIWGYNALENRTEAREYAYTTCTINLFRYIKMINYIFIAIILLLLTSTFFGVYVWKKRNFVKELYVEPLASALLFAIAFVFSVGIIIAYLISQQTSALHWSGLFAILIADLVSMGAYAITATDCVYLNDNVLIRKNIFCTKKIVVNRKTQIIHTMDRIMVKSEETAIVIGLRYMIGHTSNLIYTINLIIKDDIN